MYVLYIFGQRVCDASTLLTRTTAVHGGSNTLSLYSCGGFNTPTLCVVTKGIKADCNHLMRTTYPDACVGVVDCRSGTDAARIKQKQV